MAVSETGAKLTPALEDYLETIYRLVARNGFARVRDIAEARQVRPASVSPAMKRLEALGLIKYERREYVGLSPEGEETARRIYSRHQILRRFFKEFLGLPDEIAEEDACATEHSLSPETADSLVRLFEFIEVCPEAEDLIARFRKCSLVHPGVAECEHSCPARTHTLSPGERITLNDLEPGQKARIIQIEGQGDVRQSLLDMGLLTGVLVRVLRIDDAESRLWIKLQGFEISLDETEAENVMVERA